MTISKLRRQLKHDATFIVGGCLPKTDKESLQSVFKGKTIDPTDFSALTKFIKSRIDTTDDAVLQRGAVKINQEIIKNIIMKTAKAVKDDGFVLVLRRVYNQINLFLRSDFGKCRDLPVSKGCCRNCAYCAIRFAIGPLKSRSSEVIIREFNAGLQSGCKIFNLYADCLGDYGLDIGTNLGELLNKFEDIRGKFALNINDLHPEALVKYFECIDALSQQRKIHVLHLPIQSASQRVLTAMNRAYNIGEVMHRIRELKKNRNIYLKFDFIVGFPGESEEDFSCTMRFIKEFKHDHYFIGKYSNMPNTESSRLTEKISEAVIRERYQSIRKLGVDIFYTL